VGDLLCANEQQPCQSRRFHRDGTRPQQNASTLPSGVNTRVTQASRCQPACREAQRAPGKAETAKGEEETQTGGAACATLTHLHHCAVPVLALAVDGSQHEGVGGLPVAEEVDCYRLGPELQLLG
jgi:hypothetical protein